MKEKRWMVSARKADFNKIAKACGISPVLARLIRNRGAIGVDETRQFLMGNLEDLRDPALLPDVQTGAEILRKAILGGNRIRIIGDYDVDGICASYILWHTITSLGGSADAVLPERVRDGYGINERLVRDAAAQEVDLIVTCDNGIAAAGPLQLAVDLGMTVVVTDHHEVPYTTGENGEKTHRLPPGEAVINPKRTDPESGEPYYPFPEICGAVVAYKLCQVLCKTMGTEADGDLLSFAALATVCDVMPLLDENRVIVREGLRQAARTSNCGLKALLEVTGLWGEALTVYYAGFVVGPCLNATGRLGSAEKGLALFQERDPEKALYLAQELKDLNDSRKSMTVQGVENARQQILERHMEQEKVLVLYLEDCHESLAGIIAGRLKETFQRPAFVLTRTESGLLKGSGRSIEQYDMYAEMNACSDLLEKFGGHKMAGGLTLRPGNLEAFHDRLQENCVLTEDDFVETLHVDMELPPHFLDLKLTRELEKLEPCGTENPRPIFVTRNIMMCGARVFGRNRNVIKINALDKAGRRLELIRFDGEDSFCGAVAEKCGPAALQRLMRGNGDVVIDMVYYPSINTWNGRESMQYVVLDFRVSTY